eukprot:scaffold133279_cov69-Phaeocystis_antarctica.AAC.1
MAAIPFCGRRERRQAGAPVVATPHSSDCQTKTSRQHRTAKRAQLTALRLRSRRHRRRCRRASQAPWPKPACGCANGGCGFGSPATLARRNLREAEG